MAGKQDQVLDAAIELVGTRGLRALTHRAVDELAGMPQGSTSNYFRSRGALLEGLITRLGQRDRDDFRMLAKAPPEDREELVNALAAFVRYATGPDRVRTTARYALFVEAASTPALETIIRSIRSRLVEWGADMLEQVGSRDPAAGAAAITDYVDGVVLHQLTMPDPQFDPATGIGTVVGAFV
ncbi:TetR/AcrR family transcriptional regulator [Rhodococcus sp. WMMA185]|uniref:TetR/AcrR family transcriptional regulator n=1 Tax=Rhodococcus sp. WMMA185 TaxID=679318 RepID=UPI00087917C7|nr:TetR family transcriptional regulator [Rhodococcus sp. WMMA185]